MGSNPGGKLGEMGEGEYGFSLSCHLGTGYFCFLGEMGVGVRAIFVYLGEISLGEAWLLLVGGWGHGGNAPA